MKVLVCGGRDFSDPLTIYGTLDRLHREHGIELLIHGACPSGADRMADLWGRIHGVPQKRYPANWKEWGPSAGPRRNGMMLLENPDLVVAFPGGKGTASMIHLAKCQSFDVLKVTVAEDGTPVETAVK